jgi:glucan biosynthesis protein C
MEAWLPESSEFVARSVGNYLPFYALGMLLSAAAGLRAVFSQVHVVQTSLACLLLAVAHRLPDGCPKWAMESFLLAAQTYAAVCLSSLLFWAARKWLDSKSKMMSSLAESAYTVYLFHFLFLYLCAFALRGLVRNDLLLLLLISVGTFAATFCVHRFLIRRVGLLNLLFNGKVA